MYKLFHLLAIVTERFEVFDICNGNVAQIDMW